MKKLIFISAAFFMLLCGMQSAEAQPFNLNSLLGMNAKVDTDDPKVQMQKFMQFYSILNGAYVDTVKNEVLIEDAIKSVLQQLDPHSTYITAEEMVGIKESFDGSFSGIGVEFNVLNDTIIVVNVISGGPSESVGILPNDRIVAVDGKSVVGTKQLEVPKILRGPRGTRVDLGIVRKGEPEMLDFTVVRDNIPINTIDAAYKIDSHTGYIKVNRFANNTYSEFLEAYKKLGKIDALVLDLRNNGGGLLDQAIDLSNFFLPRGSVIVSTEGMRVPSDSVVAEEDGPFTTGKVIVLTNESSASGSEIVAGAIQDWDRGLIIGRRTFGKGLVQRQFPFQDGSAVRLTIARYHTPSGRVIQRPYQMGAKDAYYEEFEKRLSETDTGVEDSTKMYKTLRTGRTVYGGGGIFPDVYVQIDTTQYTPYWGNLVRKGVITEFVVDYMDHHRKELSDKYKNVDQLRDKFEIGDDIIDQLVALGTKRGVELNQEELLISKPKIKTQIKALIAQKLWDMGDYFYIVNPEDEIYLKALDVLENWDSYSKGIVH